MLNRAVFLDRDGTINEEVGHLDHESDLALIEGAAEGIALLKDAGFKIVIVTNQSVIARGRISEVKLRQIHLALTEVLSANGARFDAIYYCPHHPQEGDGDYTVSCDCRKPRPGMLLQASRELEIDLRRSYIVVGTNSATLKRDGLRAAARFWCARVTAAGARRCSTDAFPARTMSPTICWMPQAG